jgi:hypothetical protein
MQSLRIDDFEQSCIVAALENQVEILEQNEKKLLEAPLQNETITDSLVEVRRRLSVCKSLLHRLTP